MSQTWPTTVSVLIRVVLLLFAMTFNSAKLGKDDAAPQSNYVRVSRNGWCSWSPFYSRSVSHCSIDSTWFPFDEQCCDMIYETWKYSSNEVNFTTDNVNSNKTIFTASDFFPNALWKLEGNCLPCSLCLFNNFLIANLQISWQLFLPDELTTRLFTTSVCVCVHGALSKCRRWKCRQSQCRSQNVEMSKCRQWKWRKSEWRTVCAICCDCRNTCKEKRKKSCHTYMCISTLRYISCLKLH